MKNLRQFVVMILVLTFVASVAEAQFRNTEWGMSKQEVKSAEKNKLLREQANTLMYQDTFAGLNMYIQYMFPPDRDNLARARYFLGESHDKRMTYIDDYEKLKQKLTEQYGEPHTDTLVWKNEMYKGQQDQYGKALAEGHVNYISQWNTQNTSIRAQLWGDQSGEIQLIAQYTSKKYGKLMR